MNFNKLQFLALTSATFVCFTQIVFAKNSNVVKLTESTWRESLTGEWMIKFYAPWCPACKSLAPKWEKVAEWSRDLNVGIAEVDVTEQPGMSGRFFITALPTIYHVKDGVFRRYMGGRSDDEVISFLDDGKYKELEPVSWWKSPTSPQMGAISAIFRISMQVRVMHNAMTEDYGFPTWLSYLVFAVATIITGLLLGLILVLLADCVFPPRPYRPSNPSPREQQPPLEQQKPQEISDLSQEEDKEETKVSEEEDQEKVSEEEDGEEVLEEDGEEVLEENKEEVLEEEGEEVLEEDGEEVLEEEGEEVLEEEGATQTEKKGVEEETTLRQRKVAQKVEQQETGQEDDEKQEVTG